MAEDDETFDEESDGDELENELLSFNRTSMKINMDARRKLEYLQELKALKAELGDDYYDNLIDQL